MKFVFGWLRNQVVLALGTLLVILLSVLQFNLAPTQAQPQTLMQLDAPPQEITEGWQYYWGDFPLNEAGIPVWTQEKISSLGWHPFQFPKRLWKQPRQAIVWLRVPLPSGQWQSPALYLRAVPYILGAYIDNKPIYTELSLNSLNQVEREDYQLPIIPLEPNSAGKTIFFRVYAGYASAADIYIGLFDRVMVGSQTSLIKHLIQKEIGSILGTSFALLGLMALLISLNRQEKQAYIKFGLLSILVGTYTTANSQIITLFFSNIIALDYIQNLSFYLIPISGCIFFEEVFGARYRSIIRYLWQINLAYALIAITLVTTNLALWSQTIFPAQLLFLVNALVLLFAAIKILIRGNQDAKLFTFGFIILTLSAVHDILVYILTPATWHSRVYPWGTLVFILISGFILESRFNQARKRLQTYAVELETKNADLKRLDQLKDEFLANTSHELKTPLNGIIGIAESLIDGVTGKLSQQTVLNLSLIALSGRRLTQLVNDLLDFSQLKHKKLELKIKPVGMREVTDIVLMLSRSLIGKKPLQLINSIDSDIPPVDADENRVQQILHNLVGNAIKFTQSGIVEVSAAVVHDMLSVTVTDTGIGIPVDKFEQIFESFEQADGSMKREYGGAGLGLAVTQQLVQLHGGNIHVESTVGVGSRLTFTLPLSKSRVESKQQEEVSKVQDLLAPKLSANELLIDTKTSVAAEGGFQILIVDDEPVNLQVLVNHLSLQNYAITQASNGIEALELIHNGLKPDLILLDVMMPKMTGYEFCKKIREQFPANEMPVVLLTVKNQVSDLVEGFSSGANDYLTKPISKNELLTRIKTHIRLAKINEAYGRFVPHEFLRFLERESIVDVQLGDQVQKDMTVLFADIRSFTTLSERMTPKQNFDFLNACLSEMSPVIRKHNGFIDKYIGDAIMALFPQTSEDAVQAAIEMQKQISLYNEHLQKSGDEPIAIGIGLHTGSLMLGTVGEAQRMETTVISDAVNLASRLEGLTKVYGVDILLSEQTLYRLNDPQRYKHRFLGRVKVKGKTQPVDIFEVYEADSQPLLELKEQTRTEFEQGVALYLEDHFAQAQQIFEQVLRKNQQDRATQLYVKRCYKVQNFGTSALNGAIG